MKTLHFTVFLILSIILTFSGCNATKKTQELDSNAHQQASTTGSFPRVRRPTNEVVCHNCRATFKLSMATQKQAQGKSYIECPICHQDYLKKAK